MNNKKYLAWFMNPPDDELTFFAVAHSTLIKKISEKFEKVYLINVENLKFFSNKKKIDYKLNKDLKLPNNFEFFCPLDFKDFKKFMIGKELIGINGLARGIAELKVHFLISRYKIKQVQISNFGNLQTNMKPLKTFFWKCLLTKLIHDYSHKFTVLLSNVGIVSKMEIRFVSDSGLIKYRKNGVSLLKKVFNFFNLHYAKELILVNSYSFDAVKEKNVEVEET